MKPWSSAEYMLHYIRLDDPPDGDYAVIQRSIADELAPMPMVRASSLAELWPWGAWVADDSSEDASSQVAADQETRQRGAASLWDLALSKLVKAMVSSRHEDFVGLLEAPKQLPNFSRRLRDKLFAVKDDLVASSAAAELLRAAFAGETFLDWSLFFGLAPETITDALQGPELVEARGLSICPDWNTTTPSALAEAICSFPHLHDLYIMESPARLNEGPIGDLYLALAANPRCPRGKIFLAGASSHAVKLRMWMPTTKTSLPLPSFPIQQLIITPFAWPDLPRSRDVSLYYLQLADAFLTPSRFVGGLLSLLASIAATDDLSLRACAMSAAHIFAFAPALDRPSALEIGALPAETFTMAKMVHHRHIKHRSTKMRDLLPGAWTVLADTKPDPARRCANGAPPPYPPQRSFQVAFVRPKTKTIRADPTNPTSFRAKELEVLGLENFLRFAAPEVDIAWLDRRLEQIQEILGGLAREFNRDDQILISRRPMDARAACNLLKHAIECLPTVDREYGDLMAANELSSAQFWYPEVDQQPQPQQPAAEAEPLETGNDPSSVP